MAGWILVALLAPAAAASDVVALPGEPPPPGLSIEVNLPAYRLSVLVAGAVAEEHEVCVGAASHPTPVGAFELSRLVWNPWWHPPASPWAAGRSPVPPGPGNPMGRVKLYFRDLYYVHGTSDTASLGCASSHGCIRMSNPEAVDLARRVHLAGVRDASPEEIERLVSDPRTTRRVVLDHPVPLEIVYRVAEVRSGDLLLHADIYRREPEGHAPVIAAALREAGRQFAAEEAAVVDGLASLAPRPGEPTVAISLADLP